MKQTRVSKTSIFVGVQEGFEYAAMMGHASLITGMPGIGKTTALEEIARLNPRATLIRVAAPQSTPRAALNLIGEALQIGGYGKSASLLWEIFESHFSYRGNNYILIFDEAQNLPLSILKEMVDLPSRYQIPVIICGNGELLKRRRVSSAAFDQIESRIAKRVILTAPTREDFEMIAVDFDAFGKDAQAACIAYGSWWAKHREVAHLCAHAIRDDAHHRHARRHRGQVRPGYQAEQVGGSAIYGVLAGRSRLGPKAFAGAAKKPIHLKSGDLAPGPFARRGEFSRAARTSQLRRMGPATALERPRGPVCAGLIPELTIK